MSKVMVFKKYHCEIEDYKEHQDSGRFRSYSLQTEGNDLDDLLSNCFISEIDQDGGEITNYHDCGDKEIAAITDWLNEKQSALAGQI